ncbi:hypothetical protein [Streptomyces sp. NBC_01092]|uniref:hypothetical protein n=1 Tax=Streptomyces sp. NBC_01092 TaxID=2903748 RepID=UPI00386B7844|nr:hypothetical protein OG254_23260 [Streptomyces sp. NBC_01092]
MRSLLAAILSLFLPARGVHRADSAPPSTPWPPRPACSPTLALRPRSRPAGVIAADGQPLVRSDVVVWERERDDLERRRLRRQRRRVEALAAQGRDYFPWEAAV